MITNKVIGGEFELSYESLTKNNSNHLDGFFFSSGRAALYHIVEHIKTSTGHKRIFIPDYLCESVINILRHFDIEIYRYLIKEDLTVDIEDLSAKYIPNSIVLLVNYFGGIELQTVNATIKNWDKSSIVILDNVQAFFEMFNRCDADYIFTSFRKTLPMPDGAWVKTKKDELIQFSWENSYSQYKAIGMIAKNFKMHYILDDQIFLKLLEKGEEAIDENLNKGISNLSLDIFASIDLSSVAKKRISNSCYLEFELKKLGINTLLHFNKGCVPLFLPVLFPNKLRDKIRLELANNNIFCPIHWPVAHKGFFRGIQMQNEELSLVIDQRYNQEDLMLIVKTIERILN
jgi:hypothetical protein